MYLTKPKKMPVAFFGHGSPTNVLEDNVATRCWADMAQRIGKPKAILSISAHWCTSGTRVTAMAAPNTIHDFGRGLPSQLFDQQYNAPGSPELAQRVQALLHPVDVTLDYDWGLDHGTWSVLAKAYPEADIPVVQLSMDQHQSEDWHYALAQKLQPLRDEGILIAGSGNIVHNLGVLQWNDHAKPYPWAVRFNDYIKKCIADNNPDGVIAFADKGQDAVSSVPSKDHFWPLLYSLGAAMPDDDIHFLSDYIVFASLGMTSILFERQS